MQKPLEILHIAPISTNSKIRKNEKIAHWMRSIFDDYFFYNLKMEKFPILINHLSSGASGTCRFNSVALKNEVELDVRTLHFYRSSNLIDNLKSLYLHECAHRIIYKNNMLDESHGVIFFSLQLILYARAGVSNDRIKIYDIQDSLSSDALEFAFLMCRKYADLERGGQAESLPEKIENDWQHHLKTINDNKNQQLKDVQFFNDEMDKLELKKKNVHIYYLLFIALSSFFALAMHQNIY